MPTSAPSVWSVLIYVALAALIFFSVKLYKKNPKKFRRAALTAAAAAAVLVIAFFALRAAGIRNWRCEECRDSFFGQAYYGMNGDEIMCRDCAREYWAPFDYKEHTR